MDIDLKDWINTNLKSPNGKYNKVRITERWLEKYHPNTYDYIKQQTLFLNDDCEVVERLFCIENDIIEPVLCKNCQKNRVNFMKGRYNDNCSRTCSNQIIANDLEVKKKKEQTCIERYGGTNPMSDSNIVNKIVTSIKARRPPKEEVEHLHHIEKWPIHKIAKRYGYQHQIFGQIMREMGILILANRSDRIERPPLKELEKLYYDKRMTISNMARHYDVSTDTMRRWMAGFSRVNNYVPKNKIDIPPKEELFYLHYEKKKPFLDIAKIFNVSDVRIGAWFRHYGLENKSFTFTSSSEEREIVDFIRSLGFDTSKRKYKYHTFSTKRELDICIDSKKLAIEYCGIMWHSEISGRGYSFHRDKMRMAQHNGYQLLTIFDYEWKTKNDIVKSIIRNKLGVNRKIYARKCDFNSISLRHAKEFLNENHLQGSTNHIQYAFGLFNENELVGCICYGSHHRGKLNNELIMTRLCFKKGLNVVGGPSKLFRNSLRLLPKGKDIITWSDNRWSNGNVYEKLGFKFDSSHPPAYFYQKAGTRYPATEMMKSKTGCPKDMKEHEWAAQNGFYRVWDCGKVKWKYKVS